jgi:hypothetical protein
VPHGGGTWPSSSGLAFSGRRAKLHVQHSWPWANELRGAFTKRKTLGASPGYAPDHGFRI